MVVTLELVRLLFEDAIERAIVEKHLETATDDEAVRARIVIQKGQSDGFARVSLDIPGILLQVVFLGAEQVIDRLPALIDAYALRNEPFSGGVHGDIGKFVGLARRRGIGGR